MHAEFEGSGENYSQNSRWRQEIEAKLQEEEDTQMQMLMEFRSRKSSNGSGYAVPNGVGIGNGRVGMPIQYNPVNGKNGSFCDRDGNHYDRGSDVSTRSHNILSSAVIKNNSYDFG